MWWRRRGMHASTPATVVPDDTFTSSLLWIHRYSLMWWVWVRMFVQLTMTTGSNEPLYFSLLVTTYSDIGEFVFSNGRAFSWRTDDGTTWCNSVWGHVAHLARFYVILVLSTYGSRISVDRCGVELSLINLKTRLCYSRDVSLVHSVTRNL